MLWKAIIASQEASKPKASPNTRGPAVQQAAHCHVTAETVVSSSRIARRRPPPKQWGPPFSPNKLETHVSHFGPILEAPASYSQGYFFAPLSRWLAEKFKDWQLFHRSINRSPSFRIQCGRTSVCISPNNRYFISHFYFQYCIYFIFSFH